MNAVAWRVFDRVHRNSGGESGFGKEGCPKKAARAPAAPGAIRPFRETLSKSVLVNFIAEQNELPRKTAVAAYATLEGLVLGSLHPRGAGKFKMPRMFKVTLRRVPARRAGTLVRIPSTGGMVPGVAEPASVRVKIRPLSKPKNTAAG